MSYWGWEDNSPFTNTSLQWLPGEPNDSGFCAYLERAQVSGLRANPCNANTDGLICEKAVGEALVTIFHLFLLFGGVLFSFCCLEILLANQISSLFLSNKECQKNVSFTAYYILLPNQILNTCWLLGGNGSEKTQAIYDMLHFYIYEKR